MISMILFQRNESNNSFIMMLTMERRVVLSNECRQNKKMSKKRNRTLDHICFSTTLPRHIQDMGERYGVITGRFRRKWHEGDTEWNRAFNEYADQIGKYRSGKYRLRQMGRMDKVKAKEEMGWSFDLKNKTGKKLRKFESILDNFVVKMALGKIGTCIRKKPRCEDERE